MFSPFAAMVRLFLLSPSPLPGWGWLLAGTHHNCPQKRWKDHRRPRISLAPLASGQKSRFQTYSSPSCNARSMSLSVNFRTMSSFLEKPSSTNLSTTRYPWPPSSLTFSSMSIFSNSTVRSGSICSHLPLQFKNADTSSSALTSTVAGSIVSSKLSSDSSKYG